MTPGEKAWHGADGATAFLDTNVLVSGVFFDGPEATLLDTVRLRHVTAAVCRRELHEVAARKADAFGVSEAGAREMIEAALIDVDVVPEEAYADHRDEAAKLVGEGADAGVLAAVLVTEPDHFVTGDQDFHVDAVRERVNVDETRDVLDASGLSGPSD